MKINPSAVISTIKKASNLWKVNFTKLNQTPKSCYNLSYCSWGLEQCPFVGNKNSRFFYHPHFFIILGSPSSISAFSSSFPYLLNQFPCLFYHSRVSFIIPVSPSSLSCLPHHCRVSLINFWVFFIIVVSLSSISGSSSSLSCLPHQFLDLLHHCRVSLINFWVFFIIVVPLFFYRHSRPPFLSSFPRRRESSTVHKSILHFPINEPTLAMVCERSITVVKY